MTCLLTHAGWQYCSGAQPLQSPIAGEGGGLSAWLRHDPKARGSAAHPIHFDALLTLQFGFDALLTLQFGSVYACACFCRSHFPRKADISGSSGACHFRGESTLRPLLPLCGGAVAAASGRRRGPLGLDKQKP
jgi:hypothetical protein